MTLRRHDDADRLRRPDVRLAQGCDLRRRQSGGEVGAAIACSSTIAASLISETVSGVAHAKARLPLIRIITNATKFDRF